LSRENPVVFEIQQKLVIASKFHDKYGELKNNVPQKKFSAMK